MGCAKMESMSSAGAASASAESRPASLLRKLSCAARSSLECSREPEMLPCAKQVVCVIHMLTGVAPKLVQ